MRQAYLHNWTRTASCRRSTVDRLLLMTLLLCTFFGGAKADDTTTGPSSNRAMFYKDGYWNTLYLSFDITAEQVMTQLAPTELMELDTKSIVNGHVTGYEKELFEILHYTI